MRGVSSDVVEAAAKVARKTILDGARVPTGGDFKLSNVRWQSGRLSVIVERRDLGADAVRVLLPGPKRGGGAAVWSFIEKGTRPHPMGRKGRHPGTRGKHAWTDAVRKARGLAADAGHDAYAKAVG